MADREDEEGRALHQAVPAPLPPQREVLQVTLPTAQPRVHPQGPSLAPHDSLFVLLTRRGDADGG